MANSTTRPRLSEEQTSADRPAPTVVHPDPIADLLAFHGDIRDALDALERCGVAAARGDSDASAATYLSRFFDGPLLWHDEDEEVSVLRRLRAMELSDAERALVESAHRGHDRMERLLESIVPMLQELASGGAVDLNAFEKCTLTLRALLDAHLRLEETSIFPLALRALRAEDLDAIEKEIDARHGRSMRESQRSRRAIPL